MKYDKKKKKDLKVGKELYKTYREVIPKESCFGAVYLAEGLYIHADGTIDEHPF